MMIPAMEVSPDVEFREKSLAGLIPSMVMKRKGPATLPSDLGSM